jgi:hypothetical protein
MYAADDPRLFHKSATGSFSGHYQSES